MDFSSSVPSGNQLPFYPPTAESEYMISNLRQRFTYWVLRQVSVEMVARRSMRRAASRFRSRQAA